MNEALFELLDEFEYEYHKQGTLPDNRPYPDNFFTWYNPYTENAEIYDNRPRATNWEYDVAFYSVNPQRVTDTISALYERALDLGYEVDGKGYDVSSGRQSHTGRLITITIKEK